MKKRKKTVVMAVHDLFTYTILKCKTIFYLVVRLDQNRVLTRNDEALIERFAAPENNNEQLQIFGIRFLICINTVECIE